MNRSVIVGLVLFPLVLLGIHATLGRHIVAADRRTAEFRAGREAEASGDWEAALRHYESALGLLPKENWSDPEGLRTRLARESARARTPDGLLPALREMQSIASDAVRGEGVDPELRDRIRHEVGNTAYMASWLMRRAGAADTRWKPYVQLSRDQLAELSKKGDPTASDNLERIASFQQATDEQVRNRPFPDPSMAAAFKLEEVDESSERRDNRGSGRPPPGQLTGTGTGGGDYMKNRRGGS